MTPRHPLFCIVIVLGLISALLVGMVGMVVLALNGRELPQALIGVTFVVAGALGGALGITPLQWSNTNARPDQASPKQ